MYLIKLWIDVISATNCSKFVNKYWKLKFDLLRMQVLLQLIKIPEDFGVLAKFFLAH